MNQMSPLETVHEWHDALNRQDMDRVLQLSDENIEIVGPRGSAFGRTMLGDWLNRAGLSLQVQRSFQRGSDIVMAEHGVWRDVKTQAFIDEADVATYFKVAGEHITYLARYDSLETALEQAGMTATDEVKSG